MQDAVIREQLGRLSTLGVTLLDLPPEVAAAYAVPAGVAGGAAVLGGASTSAGAFAGGNSELQRLLHDSAEIDMSAALAIIHREHAGRRHPSGHGGVAGADRDEQQTGVPSPASVQAASTQTESRPPSLARWTENRAERLGVPPANRLPATDEAPGKTFSFPRPRNPAISQPIAQSLSPRRQASAEPASGGGGFVPPPSLAPLRSEDSEATKAAAALMADLSGSEDEAAAPTSGGGWLGRGRVRKAGPGKYEAEMQRRQVDRGRERAEDKRNAAATAAGAVAAAAAADAERRREQQRLAEDKAQQERMRAEAAAREEAERSAEAQRAREAAAAAEEREARAAAQREAERADSEQAAARAAAARSAQAAAAASAAAAQAESRAHAAEKHSAAVRKVESDAAQAAAMERATEHAADAAELQVSENGQVLSHELPGVCALQTRMYVGHAMGTKRQKPSAFALSEQKMCQHIPAWVSM